MKNNEIINNEKIAEAGKTVVDAAELRKRNSIRRLGVIMLSISVYGLIIKPVVIPGIKNFIELSAAAKAQDMTTSKNIADEMKK